MKIGAANLSVLTERPTRTRFVGNKKTKEIHRLDAENKSGNGCQVDEAIERKHGVEVKNVTKHIRRGWDLCAKCWGADLSER